MKQFVLTKKAKSDLRSIAIYTEQNWGREQRNKYIADIDKIFHLLAKNQRRGRSCDDVRNGYFKYEIGKHIIFYHKIDKNMIEVVRILHQKMDIESHL